MWCQEHRYDVWPVMNLLLFNERVFEPRVHQTDAGLYFESYLSISLSSTSSRLNVQTEHPVARRADPGRPRNSWSPDAGTTISDADHARSRSEYSRQATGVAGPLTAFLPGRIHLNTRALNRHRQRTMD
ncbi:hypothetical protein AB1N83_007857 [Pleurotus pulmonarius]